MISAITHMFRGKQKKIKTELWRIASDSKESNGIPGCFGGY